MAQVGGIIRSCDREYYAHTSMMQEIARKRGNFCGVCPVIGRLNCSGALCVYRCARNKGRPSVGHFSWPGVIRTEARTRIVRPYPGTNETEYVFKEENNHGKQRNDPHSSEGLRSPAELQARIFNCLSIITQKKQK